MGSAELHAAAQGKPSLTPITESSTFAITAVVECVLVIIVAVLGIFWPYIR